MDPLGWMRRNIDQPMVQRYRDNAAADAAAAVAARKEFLAARPEEYLTRDPSVVAGEVAGVLGTGPRKGEDPAVTAARETLMRILYESTSTPPPRNARSRGPKEDIAAQLQAMGIGSGAQAGAATAELRNALAQAAAVSAPSVAFPSAMARVNEHLAANPWSRAALNSAMVGGGVAGVAGVTPAALELLKMAGLVGPGDDDAPMG